MDLKQLRYFLMIAELQNVTQAAEALHISQPALGIQVRNLEAELDIQLLIRHSRGVELTEAGLMLAERARDLLASAAEIKREVSDKSGVPRGVVSLGMTPSSGHLVAAALFKKVAVELPAVDVKIVENSSFVLSEWIGDERLDLALSYDSALSRTIEREVLLVEGLYFLSPYEGRAPKAPPEIDFNDVLQQPLILPGPGDSVRREIDRLARERGAKLNVSIEMKSSGIVCDLVKEGFGSTVFPLGAIERYVDRSKIMVRRIVNPVPSRELSLLRPQGRSMSLAESHVTRLLNQLVKERWDEQVGTFMRQSNSRSG